MVKICYTWGFASVLWNKGDWTWDECELIKDTCAIWNETSNPWNAANWWWSMCSGSIPPIPPIPPISVVSVVQPPGIDATTIIQPWLIEPWNPYKAGEDKKKQDKKKRLIKLICKVKGETYEEEKEIGDYKISIDDIKTIVDIGSNINLNVNLEK